MRPPIPLAHQLAYFYLRPQGDRGGRQPLRRHDSVRQDRGVRPAGDLGGCGGEPGNVRHKVDALSLSRWGHKSVHVWVQASF